jgi:hypothetical protein
MEPTPGIIGVMFAVPAAPHCHLPPRGFTLERRVDRLPVAPDSGAIVGSIGAGAPVHADFGSGRYQGSPIGIPFNVVSHRTRRVRLRFTYADESDRVRYPIPRHVRVEGGSDRHALLLDRDSCRLYELFALHHGASGWNAGSGAVWNLRRPKPRPSGWTSADAAGLPTSRAAAARSSSPPATRPATATTRRCRAWASACG